MSESFPGISPPEIELYINNMIGDSSEELQKMTFTDEKQTTYLMAIKYYNANFIWAIKYNVNLIWESYNLNKNMLSVNKQVAMVHTDVLNTALLSLHPIDLLEKKDISERTKKTLEDVSKFRDLILMKDYNEADVKIWLEEAPNMNYTAQLCLMGWFLTLASKMTGLMIPGVSRVWVVGGQIRKEKNEAVDHLNTMVKISKAMYDKNYWYYLAKYSTLKKMYEDLSKIVEQF